MSEKIDNSNSSSAPAISGQDQNNYAEREFRWHALLQQWVIIAASTSNRPWSGSRATAAQTTTSQHDPGCYLCPGVTRSSGTQNPDYEGPYAFDNDYPSLAGSFTTDSSNQTETIFDNGTTQDIDELHHGVPSAGACRVLCWSERHDQTLADLANDEMINVARLWRDEFSALKNRQDIAQVLIFENKGLEIGVSNLHPHGQIYATPFVTDTARRMRKAQAAYAHKHESPLLQQLLQRPEYSENADDSLLIEEGVWFKTIVPYFARFSYETWIVPKQHTNFIDAFDDSQLSELAALYQRQVKRYDVLFQRSSPNITLLHNAPCDEHGDNEWCCFHIAMQPPLREPDKLKFLAGFESGAGNIVNPMVPEIAARQLRKCSANI